LADEPPQPDTESLLRRLIEVVNNAKPLPMSTSVRVTKDEVLELLAEALDRLPEELRKSRWMLKERADFVAKTQREAADILEAARVRAERMVQRTEIVREAAHTAQRLVDDAREEASRLRLEAEDYCDQKLANFEIVFERLLKTARLGREKLRVATLPEGNGLGLGEGEIGDEEAFFDQEHR
jgi:cell division septum initiation protein DivIVA